MSAVTAIDTLNRMPLILVSMQIAVSNPLSARNQNAVSVSLAGCRSYWYG